MIEVGIAGIGCWSPCFSNWGELRKGFRDGVWADEAKLVPEILPPPERRRAPKTVKMAIEVLGQACTMSAIEPHKAAVVFSSAMGDMDITDAICSTLARQPELVSPTRFHNSVHNAAIGYWSIATGAHTPTTAVAGHDHSAALGLLEAATQAAVDGIPVLFVCQEGSAPQPLVQIRNSLQPLALAMMLTPPGAEIPLIAHLKVSLLTTPAEATGSGAPSASLPLEFEGNPASRFLPLFEQLALIDSGVGYKPDHLTLPISDQRSISIEIHPGGET
ncbi:MAG TPA: beta-ketoacyl synthase chain length factor [Xanthomonadales bacterium]|nr:beta-ketoacyl synthase chain length factor [Xanthomonadales bacterium]